MSEKCQDCNSNVNNPVKFVEIIFFNGNKTTYTIDGKKRCDDCLAEHLAATMRPESFIGNHHE